MPAALHTAHPLPVIREQQRLAWATITFRVTRRCPASCAHCYEESGPKLASAILGLDFARQVARELPALRSAGLEFMGFTGGEPTLAADFVRHVSDACVEHGIQTGIVSAAQWASSDAAAQRMLERLPHLSTWDLSVDRYHLQQIPLGNVERAYRALAARGSPPLIRFAYHRAPTSEAALAAEAALAFDPEDAALVRQVFAFAGERISFQPVQPRGRGRLLPLRRKPNAAGGERPLFCMSEGLFVDEEGRISPCGSLLAAERSAHPLLLGSAFSGSLLAALERWRSLPLLQLLRLGALPGVLDDGAGCAQLAGGSDCERCVSLMRCPERVAELVRTFAAAEARTELERAHAAALAVS